MADFGSGFISGVGDKVLPNGDVLNRKIDYQREKFLKGISTSKHGKKEDPTYLHFRFIFDEGNTNKIDPETFLAPSPLFRRYGDPGKQGGPAGATGDKAVETKSDEAFSTEGTSSNFFYPAKFQITGMAGSGAIDPQGGFAYMSAQEFLFHRSEKRRDMLDAFKKGFLYINKNSPYYFQSLSGLDQLLRADIKNIHKGAGKPQRMGTLTIDCLESIDMRIFALSELYRKGIYDYTYHRSMLPENLRKFRMWLVITEIRNIQLSYGINDVLNPFSFPGVSQAANFLDTFNSQSGLLDNTQGLLQKSTNSKDPYGDPSNTKFGTDELGPYAFIYQFDQCEFDFDDSYPSYSSIDNKGGSAVTNKFKIHVGRVKDYKIQFNQLADILGKNDNIKQMVINDTWGSNDKDAGYGTYDYEGSDGFGKFDASDKANPAEYFSQLASNFITNSVADLKNIGTSQLQGALLGNIYGLGGFNPGTQLRSYTNFDDINSKTSPFKIPDPSKDNTPQGQGLGGPGQREYPTIKEDAYTGTSSQNNGNLGNVLGGGSNPPGVLSGDVYPNVPGTDLGAPDRQYPSNNSDEYNNVPGSDSGVPGRVYPVPGGDVYSGVPGSDLGVPDRQYPVNSSDEYNNVSGSDLGVPDRVYPAPGGDVYGNVPGSDLGVPDRVYQQAGGDEYSNVPGSDLGVIGRVYEEPVGDVYNGVPGADLGVPDRQYPSAGGNEYPDNTTVTDPSFTKIYPDANNKYPQVNEKEYKDSPKGFIDNMGDVYKNVPGPDLGGAGRNYESVRGNEYPTPTNPPQINLGRTYPRSNNSENS